MNARAALLALCAAAACGGGPTAVELRLYPCAPPGSAATSVTLEIQSRDQEGAAIGDPLTKDFSIADPAVFSDGYATVGFKPPAGTMTADFVVTWTGGGPDMTEAHYLNVAVPALGEALVLGVDACDDPGGTTGEPTTGSSGTTGEGTTGTSGATMGETTGTTGDATSTGTTTGTTEATTDASSGGTTGGDPHEGGPCMPGEPGVCDGGPGVLGMFLLCVDGTWTKSNPPCDVDTACPPELGLVQPQLIGCIGAGTNWTCGCSDTPVMECAMGETSQCGQIPGGFKVDLCVLEQGKLHHYAGRCVDCVDVDGEPLCVQQ